jgi:hypothetical protein
MICYRIQDVFTYDNNALFHQACGKSVVAQWNSQVMQHLIGSMHNATVFSLEYWPGRQSVIGESSATSYSSGHSKYATVAKICTWHLCPQTYHFSK